MTIADQIKQEGRQEGRQEGLLEGKLEIAKNLLSKGIDPLLIEESTKLSQGQIEVLKKQILH